MNNGKLNNERKPRYSPAVIVTFSILTVWIIVASLASFLSLIDIGGNRPSPSNISQAMLCFVPFFCILGMNTIIWYLTEKKQVHNSIILFVATVAFTLITQAICYSISFSFIEF